MKVQNQKSLNYKDEKKLHGGNLKTAYIIWGKTLLTFKYIRQSDQNIKSAKI